jgi:hypothetical protein
LFNLTIQAMEKRFVRTELRIAWSAVSGIVCLLLVVHWVRSFSALESWMAWSLHVQSVRGELIIFTIDRQKPIRHSTYSNVPLDHFNPSHAYSTAISGSKYPRFYVGGKRICIIPFWAAVLVTAVLPILSWTKWNGRFSLRTLLIAVTLVAAVLGFIAVSTR